MQEPTPTTPATTATAATAHRATTDAATGAGASAGGSLPGPAAPAAPSATTSPGAAAGAAQDRAAGESQEPAQERRGNWLDRLLGRRREPVSSAPEPPASTDAPAPAPSGVDDLAARLEQASDEDLARLAKQSPRLGRLVQSETDRREAKRRREAIQAEQSAEVQRLQQQQDAALEQGDAAKAREAREQLRAIEAQQRQQEALRSIISRTVEDFDAATLNQLAEALPEAERTQLLARLADLPPLEGRTTFTTEALRTLERHWRADEARKTEERLRKNPAVLKQVVLAQREADADTEPDLVPAGGAARPSADMNAFLRSAVSGGR